MHCLDNCRLSDKQIVGKLTVKYSMYEKYTIQVITY